MAHPALRIGDYYVLEGSLEEKWVDKWLGRVVIHKENPLVGFAPNEAVIPQDLVNFMGNSVPIDSMSEVSQAKSFVEGKAKLSAILNIHAKAEVGHTATVDAFVLRSYEMIQIGPNLQALMANPTYAEPVKDLFEKRAHETALPMVTKILTCESMTVKYTNDSSVDAGAEATIPATAAASHGVIPTGPLDAKVGLNAGRSANTERSKTINTRIVLAVAYSKVVYEPITEDPQPNKGFFRRLVGRFHKTGPKKSVYFRESTKEPPYMEGADTSDDSDAGPKDIEAVNDVSAP